MLSERLLTAVVHQSTKRYLHLRPTQERLAPGPRPGQKYMLYMHVPFCERLCPYCSFNRFPFSEKRAVPYFVNLRKEMMMLKELGYDFESLYVGGGTPTIMIDELCDTIDLAKETFSIKEVSSETNPNHLVPAYLDKLQGRVQRLSVGVQSFDDGLLKQMDRYDKYGSSEEILDRVGAASPYFLSLNVDMIFNFPAQTEDVLFKDLERVVESGSNQTTFYPLMASPSVARSLARTVGRVDYVRERRFYEIISEVLAGGADPLFEHSSAWTFNKRAKRAAPARGGSATFCPPAPDSQSSGGSATQNGRHAEDEGCADGAGGQSERHPAMIDEYVVDYEEYPAIGSGGITYLGHSLYVSTFSINDYNAAIEEGRMPFIGKTTFSRRDQMRYRFMMQLFGLRLDKRCFERDFGCSVEAGLPIEMAFMKAAGAFDRDTADELTLSPKGRYLMVAMMRQFFIGVNNLRDQARAALVGEERELLFG